LAVRPQLTFAPSDLVPAGGSLVVWSAEAVDGADLDAAIDALGFPPGDPTTLPTIDLVDGEVVARDAKARAVRRQIVRRPGHHDDLQAFQDARARIRGIGAGLGLQHGDEYVGRGKDLVQKEVFLIQSMN
jgi:hypothetical protein